MVGHIKLDRKILNWEWFHDHNVFRLFVYLLLTANYKEGRWKGHVIGRGELITGLDKLSVSTGLSVMQIRTCFNKLKLTNEITIKITNKYRIITICKYDVYQSFKNEDNNLINNLINSQITNKQQTSNKQVTANNNSNNSNKGEEENNKNVEKIILWEKVVIDFGNDFRWKEKFCRDKRVLMPELESKMKEFVSDIELREKFKELKELKDHFFNWFVRNRNGNGFYKSQTTLSESEQKLEQDRERARLKHQK